MRPRNNIRIFLVLISYFFIFLTSPLLRQRSFLDVAPSSLSTHPRRHSFLVVAPSSSLLPPRCSFPLATPSPSSLLLSRPSFLLVAFSLPFPTQFISFRICKHCYFIRSNERITGRPTNARTDGRTDQIMEGRKRPQIDMGGRI